MSMFNFFSISFFLVVSINLLTLLFFSCGFSFFSSLFEVLSQTFIFDSISFYFLLLVFFLGVYTQYYFYDSLSGLTRLFLSVSLLFSCLSFIVNHAIIFWCFYELSMLPLIFLIFKESPYSERFLAGWYFSCYLIVTSLPLILIFLYLGVINNSFLFSCWHLDNSKVVLLVILSFVFFTKVPLVPFHTWLPIVHAEATSIVSIFLSGYIMKLGLLGVYRGCNCALSGSFYTYLLLALTVSVLFLMVACSELDGKRWLAFLSLSHIVIPFFAFFIGDWSLINYSFFYCLGHGVSAGLVFGLLWCFYEVCGSRNWILLKTSISGSYIMYFTLLSLLSLCSFPPTIQFFCEVGLVTCSFSSMYILFWCFYLFLGGLVPLLLIGHCLIRCECLENGYSGDIKFFSLFSFLCFWCYLGIFLM